MKRGLDIRSFKETKDWWKGNFYFVSCLSSSVPERLLEGGGLHLFCVASREELGPILAPFESNLFKQNRQALVHACALGEMSR